MSSRRSILVCSLVGVSLLLAGCGVDLDPLRELAPGGTTPAPTSSAAADAFPVTIENAFGSTTIESKPERVVAWDWSSGDVVIALGVVPVAMSDVTYGGNADGYLPYVADALAALDIDTANPEAAPTKLPFTPEKLPLDEIMAADPDVIIAVNSELTEAGYQALTEIAPTVASPGAPHLTTWQQQLTTVGKALGLQSKADELLASTNQYFKDKAAEFPQLQGKSFLYTGGIHEGNLGLAAAEEPRVQLITALGLKLSPFVAANRPAGPATTFQVSAERTADMDSDLVITRFNTDEDAASFTDGAQIAQLPGVVAGGFVPVVGADAVMATSAVSVLSIPWITDQLVPRLAAVAGAG